MNPFRAHCDRAKHYFKNWHYTFDRELETKTLLNAPVIIPLSGTLHITDYEEARKWLPLSKDDRRSTLAAVETYFKTVVEPSFWDVYTKQRHFCTIYATSASSYVDSSTHGGLCRLVGNGHAEWNSGHELVQQVCQQASGRGCTLTWLALNTPRLVQGKVSEAAAMLSEEVRQQVLKSDQYAKSRESLALLIEAERLRMLNSFKERERHVPGLSIKTQVLGDKLRIEWQRRWSDDFLYVYGYHSTKNLKDIEQTGDKIVKSNARTDHMVYPLSSDTNHFLFRVLGERRSRWTGDVQTLGSEAITVLVLGPEKVDPLAQAKLKAEIAKLEAEVTKLQRAAQPERDRRRQRTQEEVQEKLENTDLILEYVPEQMNARRRKVKASNAPEHIRKIQLEIIDQIEYDLVHGIQGRK